MVTNEILRKIQAALSSPDAYVSGKNKTQLRAAFDTFCSQIFAGLFGEEPLSRMNARRRLNAAKQSEFTQKQWTIILALKKAIVAAETSLHSKSYVDHGANISTFITGELTKLVEAVNEQ